MNFFTKAFSWWKDLKMHMTLKIAVTLVVLILAYGVVWNLFRLIFA